MLFSNNQLERISYLNVFSKSKTISFKDEEIYFFLFDPECESCVKIKNRVANLEKQHRFNIYFITDNQNKKEIFQFIKNNNLQKYSSNFLIDYEMKYRDDFYLSPILELPTMISIKNRHKSVIKL